MATPTPPAAPRIERLLIGSDFSPGASAALTRIPHLPLAARAGITLVHVLPAWINPALRSREVEQAGRLLDREANGLRRALGTAGRKQVRVRTALAQGDPAAEILRRSASADLVVVGRHGRRAFRDLLVGSTAERVVQQATAPTLLVARRARAPYRRPLAAVDLSEAARPTLDLAAALVPDHERVLDVVHAFHPEHEQVLGRVGTARGRAAYRRACRLEARRAVSRLVHASRASPLARSLTLRACDPRAAILGAAAARGADLIVVGTHGRTGLPHLLLGSVAEAVMRHAGCDVLVGPPRRPARRSRRRAA